MGEVFLNEEVLNKLYSGITKLKETVEVTLGPEGNTVIIFDEYNKPKITKDGVSVSNSIKFKDPIENVGATLIKEAAQKTSIEAGDGTTTTTILAHSLIKKGLNLLETKFCTNIELQKTLESLLLKIINNLKNRSRKFTDKDIKKIAFISSNGDENITKIVYNAYSFSNIVKIEEGNKIFDEIEYKTGIEYDTTYFSKHFITDEFKQIAEIKDSLVLLLQCKINSLNNIERILKYCNDKQEPITIICEDISPNVLQLLETNKINGALDILPIKTPGYADYRKEYIKDISKITGAKIITNLNNQIILSDLGKIKNITSSTNSTLIIPENNIEVENLIKILEKRKEDSNLDKLAKEILNKRIENLKGAVSIIKVGGKSEIEMKEKYDRIEDSIYAVKSAISEGVVKGGGLTLLNIINDEFKNCNNIEKQILSCLTSPNDVLLKNGTNIDKNNKDLLDPTKVLRLALENSFSVSKTILTTRAIVLKEHQWN